MKPNDTIAAISTALAASAIGIVKISGPQAVALAQPLFQGKIALNSAPTHRLLFGHIVNPKTNEIVDEVLVSVMRAPNSYTREDVVEINAHGGPLVLKQILKLILEQGARLAEPGEFTKRAFLNGRIDLTQAEAVAELVSAKSEAAAKAATMLLKGKLAEIIKNCQQELINCQAHLEAAIDYSDEDINPDNMQTITSKISSTLKTVNNIIKSSENQRFVKQGIKTAIVGRPNVGKSSLLNALLQEERAIVTEIAGTTRDIVSETFSIAGYNFILCDTAGISFSAEDKVEKIGISRAKALFNEADLALIVIDSSEDLMEEDKFLLKEAKEKKHKVIVFNKIDLPTKIQLQLKDAVNVSAKTGQGLGNLREKIKETLLLNQNLDPNASLMANERQLQLLKKAAASLEAAIEAAKQGFGEEVLSLHLRESSHNLGLITGTDISKAVLDEIFKNFCLGK